MPELALILNFYMLLAVIVGPTEEPALPGKLSLPTNLQPRFAYFSSVFFFSYFLTDIIIMFKYMFKYCTNRNIKRFLITLSTKILHETKTGLK